MGCDVHPAIFRQEGSGYWMFAAVPDTTRCYALFGALAGVRWADERQIVPMRGLPTDMKISVSEWTNHWGWPWPDLGEHSFSWFSLAEARAYNARWLRTAYEESDWPYVQWLRWVEMMEFVKRHFDVKDAEGVRVVFGFDS